MVAESCATPTPKLEDYSNPVPPGPAGAEPATKAAEELAMSTSATTVEEAPASTPTQAIAAVYASAQVGERFKFGCYPQGANGEVEPIVWRVLRRDSDGLLVIAEQGLDCKKYNEERAYITWADCTLRRWLNDEFFKEAFSSEEQSFIKTVNISNNAGPSTDDRIFLLSMDEARNLFANDRDRATKPTVYATKNGVYASGNDERWKGNTWWWLRSRGDDGGYFAACVSIDGYVNSSGGYVYVNCVPDSDGDVSVRPVCLLAI